MFKGFKRSNHYVKAEAVLKNGLGIPVRTLTSKNQPNLVAVSDNCFEKGYSVDSTVVHCLTAIVCEATYNPKIAEIVIISGMWEQYVIELAVHNKIDKETYLQYRLAYNELKIMWGCDE